VIDPPRAEANRGSQGAPQTRIPPAVGVVLDAAHADVLAAERALQVARVHLEQLVRVHLASTGVDAAGCRVDRDAEGWFHAPVEVDHRR
jgi:hypothetical protein